MLKGLAAAEDDWAKFMKELHSDLSKLPEQDFANSTMLKESVEIQTELKMAEDALFEKNSRHRRALGTIGLRDGRGTENQHRKMASRHARTAKNGARKNRSPIKIKKPPWPNCPANWKTWSAI